MAQTEGLWGLTILLAIALAWALYHLMFLRRGLGVLIDKLENKELIEYEKLPSEAKKSVVGVLAKTIWQSLDESELSQVTSKDDRQVQKLLLEQVDETLLLVDEKLEIQFVNQPAKILFNAGGTLIGEPLIDFCLDHRICEVVGKAMNSEGGISKQLHRAQVAQTILVRAGKIDCAHQAGGGAWVAIRDISEQIHTEQIRRDFVANTSHELRTPLSIIKGYLELMEGDSTRVKEVAIMSKHTDRLSRIVDDMLLISRFENDGSEDLIQANNFDIGECAKSVVDQLQPLIDERQAKVKIKMPEAPGDRQVNGDQFYWDQVFFNLIENALKENLKAGLKITIRIKRAKSRKGFQIQVEDNGMGIPASDIDEVFKRFYRGDKSRSQKIKGTGLGLSIVKRAVEAHGGTIEVVSQPGARTTFTINLPDVM